MEPRIRNELLFTTATEHMEQSPRTIHNWLAIHESAITQSIKRATTKAIQGMKAIHSYFSTGRPPGASVAREAGQRDLQRESGASNTGNQ